MAKKGKQRMREWLIENLDSGRFKDTLEWYHADGSEGCDLVHRRLFRIKWLHASTGHYSENDSDLFREWCRHTGKLKATGDSPKRWKANFRCALNSLPDVTPVFELTVRKGKNAYRVFEILNEKLPEKVAKKRASNQKCSSKKTKHRKLAVAETCDETIQRRRAPVVKPVRQSLQQRLPRRNASARVTSADDSLRDLINCNGSNGSSMLSSSSSSSSFSCSSSSSSAYSDLPSTVEDMNNNEEKEIVEEEIVFDSLVDASSAGNATNSFDGCVFDTEHDRYADFGHDTNSGSSTISSSADLAYQTDLLNDLEEVIAPKCDTFAGSLGNGNVIVRTNLLIATDSGMLACQLEDVSV